MEYRKFDYKTKEEFLRDAEQLKQGIPWSDDTEVLSSDIEIEGKTVKNRLTAQPIEGFDSEKDGIPGSKSFARYQKLADGGSGMIWMESVSVSYEGKSTARQMWIREENVQEFKKLTDNMHEHGNPYLVCQITHSGRNSNPDGKHLAVCAFENPMIPRENYRTITDDELDQLKEDYVQAAILVEEAGYDAVDIRTCHGYLLNELLGAYERKGKYGGTYQNRTKLLKDIVREVKERTNLDIAVRLNITDGLAYPYGWGTAKDGSTNQDMTEPLQLVKELAELGVSILNISAGIGATSPYMIRPYNAGGPIPNEHPLEGVERLLQSAKAVKNAVPEVKVVASGFTWLQQFAPQVAAGGIREGWFDFAGFGRQWVANADYANDMLQKNLSEKYCIACGGCSALIKSGKEMRCVRVK